MVTEMQLDEVFAALADPSRRAILQRLGEGSATVGTVAKPLDMALPSVSKHVKLLEGAGLVEREVRGREHWLRLIPDGFQTAAAWLDHYQAFWAGSADRLAGLVSELAQSEPGPTEGTTNQGGNS